MADRAALVMDFERRLAAAQGDAERASRFKIQKFKNQKFKIQNSKFKIQNSKLVLSYSEIIRRNQKWEVD